MSDSLAARVEALSALDRTNAAHAIRSIATNGKRRDSTRAALLLVADMLAAHSAADTPEGCTCPMTAGDGYGERPDNCGCGHQVCPGIWSGGCPCPAPVGADADTETDHSRAVQPHTHGGTDAPECTTCRPAPVPSAERPDAARKYGGRGGPVTPHRCCGSLDVKHADDCPERPDAGTDEGLASLLCDLVDGNGYWERAGDAMRERYRHAARCLIGSDWLAQRDQRIAEAARAEGAREALLSAANEMDRFRTEVYGEHIFTRPTSEDWKAYNAVLREHFGHGTDRLGADCYDRAIRVQADLLRARAAALPTPGGESDD